MDTTPPIYIFYPTWYPTTKKDPADEDGQLSTLIICFIAFAALIALLIMLCLIVLIYNICRYGSCCPPSGYGNCCAPCATQPTEFQVVKPSPVIVQSPSYAVGTYIGRGTRLNQGSYLVDPRTIRAGSVRSRRNSIILVGQNTLPRRQVIQTIRPQIMISDSVRVPTIGRSRPSLLALPASSSSSSQPVVRCVTMNEPNAYGRNPYDDGDVRVIVRNQPYAASQSGTIIEAPFDIASSISPPPAFENLTIRKTGGMAFEGGCGMNQGVGGNFDYGFAGQHSATVDVCLDQVPDYTSDDGVQQFHQTAIYPSLGQSNFY